ncbi:MAG TPA: YkgJ family cysteine cluster protein [Methylobacter sp.]
MDIKLSEAITGIRMALADTAMKSEKKRLFVYSDKVPCRPKCAGCCKRLVVITVAEALLIYDHLMKSNCWQNVAIECRKQFHAVQISNFISWFLQGRDCPVLDPETKTCRAYSVRPAACSTHFVTSAPELCDPSYMGPGEYSSLDFEDILEEFRRAVGEKIAPYGILTVALPLQQALLLAERINLQSGLSPERVLSLFLNEL